MANTQATRTAFPLQASTQPGAPALLSFTRQAGALPFALFGFRRRAGFGDLSLSGFFCALRLGLRAGLRQQGEMPLEKAMPPEICRPARG